MGKDKQMFSKLHGTLDIEIARENRAGKEGVGGSGKGRL